MQGVHRKESMKDKILTRKKELENQAKDLIAKINQGKEAIRNME